MEVNLTPEETRRRLDELTPEEKRQLQERLRELQPLELRSELIQAQEESPWLMVILHGLGDSMEGYRDVPNWLRIPWLNYLLVNAPDPYYGGFSWYDFAGDPAPGVMRSRKLLTGLLDTVQPRFPKEKTFIFGFSQGCLMTLETGLQYPHKLAGLIGISGYVHDENALIADLSPVARDVPIFWSHGHRDPLIPLDGVKAQAQALKDAGLKIDWREYPKEHTIHPQEVEHIREFILRNGPKP